MNAEHWPGGFNRASRQPLLNVENHMAMLKRREARKSAGRMIEDDTEALECVLLLRDLGYTGDQVVTVMRNMDMMDRALSGQLPP